MLFAAPDGCGKKWHPGYRTLIITYFRHCGYGVTQEWCWRGRIGFYYRLLDQTPGRRTPTILTWSEIKYYRLVFTWRLHIYYARSVSLELLESLVEWYRTPKSHVCPSVPAGLESNPNENKDEKRRLKNPSGSY
jgi:hypothetical protein